MDMGLKRTVGTRPIRKSPNAKSNCGDEIGTCGGNMRMAATTAPWFFCSFCCIVVFNWICHTTIHHTVPSLLSFWPFNLRLCLLSWVHSSLLFSSGFFNPSQLRLYCIWGSPFNFIINCCLWISKMLFNVECVVLNITI